MSAVTAPASLARERAGAVPWLGVGTAVGVAALGGAHGGYFAPEWGWTALALAWLVAVALLVRPAPAFGRLERAALAGWSALAAWYALSTLWSSSATQSLLESERALVYPLGLLAALVVVRRVAVPQLVAGMWGGTFLVSLYALATRLFPDRLGALDAVVGKRLSAPIGYWNSLGLWCAMGALLALGLATRARSRVLRAAAAASLVTFVPTLYFTFSRGAWLALALGLAAAIAVDARRLQLVTVSAAAFAPAALGVALASRSRALVRYDALAGAAAHEGHRLAVVLAVLTLFAFAAFVLVGVRVEISQRVRRAYAWSLLVGAVAAAAAALVVTGGPLRAYDAFRATPVAGTDLNARLFSLSGSGRITQFRVALDEFRADPLAGGGAGTYEQWWLRGRPLGAWKIRDAHSAYLETLGELGIVGLALLCLAFALPLRGARRAPLVLGAYVAYLGHAAVDWDWELSAVTLVFVLCGAALLRSEDVVRVPARSRALLVVVVAVAVAAGAALVGNEAIARAGDAVRAQDWPRAERDARRAIAWAPWSSEGWKWLGEAEVGTNRLAAARADLGRAIAKDPNDWELYFDLALAEPHGGAAQLAALRRALRLDPKSPEVREFERGAGLPAVKP